MGQLLPAQDQAPEPGRARALLGSLPAAVVVVDEGLRVRFANPHAAALAGSTPAELVGARLTDLVRYEDRPEAVAALAAAISGGRFVGRTRLVVDGGQGETCVLVVEASGTGLTWVGRRAALVVALDVTERAVAESAADVVARAAALFAQASIGYLEIGPDRRVRSHNPFVARLLRTEHLRGRRVTELVVPGDRAALGLALDQVAADGGPGAELALRFRAADGAPVSCLASLAAVHDVTGSASHVGLLLLDDTERAAGVALAAEREARASGLLRALPDAVLICATDGTVVEVNDQTEELFGYRAQDLLGKPIEVLVPPDRATVHRWHRERYGATQHARPMITGPGIEGVRADGTRIPVEVNLAAVSLPSGPAVVASVRDVSEARRTAEALRASHELVAGVLGAATEQAIIATDLNGRIELFSAGAERLLGWRAEEVTGMPASTFDDPAADMTMAWGLDPGAPIEERIQALVGSGVAATRPWTFRTRSGESRHVALSVTVRSGASGASGLIIVATDETARRERDQRLAASEERFRLLFEGAPIGIALVEPGAEGRFRQVNRTLCEMLGYGPTELLEAGLRTFAHPEDADLVERHLAALVDAAPVPDVLEHRLVAADGRDVWVQTRFSRLGTSAADPALVAMLHDITDRKRAEDELTHHALHDSLTGLPNRALITETLVQTLARARRAGSGAGVLYLDLDDFKSVNDSLGHAAGDQLLVEVARRLQGCMRDSDLAGRLGGDEFIVVCDRIGHPDDIAAVAERVARALALRLPLAGRMVSVSASIGIAYSAAADDDAEELLRQADLAMYRSKGNGRGRFEFADAELQARATRQVELEQDLRSALGTWVGRGARRRARADDELILDYQPCFDCGTGRLVACEALLRWQHPRLGRLAPGEFLDVAEDRALMVPLGAWVLRTACRQASDWYRRFGAAAPEVWVNVSAAQLGRGFASQVLDALEETGLPPAMLCLELTERQAISTGRGTLEDLHALPDLGVRLMIDDFGTGYAGLEYLRRLPVAGLKVDASYVAAIGTDPAGTALAATVVGIGRALDLTVVAEGIETDDQRAAVSELGVDVLQGFLLGRPAPPDRVEALLGGAGPAR